jgi:hypothetical protein
MEASFGNLSLMEEKEEGLVLEGVRAEERTQSYNPCLVGRFFTEKMV